MMSSFGRTKCCVKMLNYPKCDVVYWDKPAGEACPKCGDPHLLEKTTRKDGTVRYCKKEECDYKMAVDKPDSTSDSPAGATTPVG